MNLLKTIETHQTRQNRITGIMAELNQELQIGTAEHFVEWHNSLVRPDKQISPNWYERYVKECGGIGDGK